jgi:hypothetical protein
VEHVRHASSKSKVETAWCLVYGDPRTPNGYNESMGSRTDREAEAAADLLAALGSKITGAAFSTEASKPGTAAGTDSVDLIMTTPHGGRWEFEVKALSRADPSRVEAMVSKVHGSHPDTIHVLVADEIPEAARNVLARAGWGYLDRRGHLRIMDALSTMLVDVDVDPLVRSTPIPRDPIRGASGISYASALLMEPDEPPSIRKVARRAHLSVSTVADAARSIRDAALIGRDGRPLIPDLFWALADVWRPERTPLLGKPIPGEASTTNALAVFGDPTELGWAVTGDLAAVSYDAPLAIGSGSPPDFYVPDRVTANNAARTYRIAPDPSAASCTVAVAPTLLACARRFESPRGKGAVSEFLLVHPVFVALDLASDKARGVEILSGWSPKGFTRVW